MLRILVASFSLLALVGTASAQLLVSSYFNSAVYQYSPTGSGLQQTLVAPFANGVNAPSRITVGPDSNLYISNQGTDATNNSVLKYDLTTGMVSTFISASQLETVAGMGNYYAPTGIRFGDDGKVYLARNGGLTAAPDSGAVDRFSAAGVFESTIATGLDQPTGLTVNGNSLYVSNLRGAAGGAFGDVDRITNYTSGMPVTSTFIAGMSGGLENPTGTTFGPDGKFYVADVSYVQNGFGNKVLRYNSDGSFDTVFVPTGTGLTPGDLAFTFPSDVLFTDSGDLLVANLGFPGSIPGTIFQYDGSTGAFELPILVDPNVSPSSLAFNPVPEPALLVLVGAVLLVRRLRNEPEA